MPWWHSLSPSSSSASATSSPKSSAAHRRLTRSPKLRHLKDFEGLVKLRLFAAELSRSPSLDRSSSAVVPQPLPLPELPAISRRRNSEGLAGARFGNCPLPSPEEALSRGTEERDRGEVVIGERIPPNASIARRRKNLEHVDTQSSKTVPQGLNGVESSQHNFRVSVPVRSAPTSPFCSPVVSPQRKSTGELCSSYCLVPPANQVWSAPEMPFVDIVSGLPPPAYLDRNAFSTDNSPLQSPQVKSPRWNHRSPSGPASPLHPKLSLETATVWRESNGHTNVHPLPLPPGAALPSPSVPISQVGVKLETLPMKSQWQKGKLIGRGTFGSVYVASNRETGALCAMKEVELLPDDSKSAECIKQLEQEIKVLSQLKHPNIVQYYGSEIVEDRFYIYLEYVHPGSINKYIREHCEAMTESVVRNFTRHILCGLAYLHGTKTIHRDIKGANLLVDAFGVVKLADFGMAKHLTGQASHLSLKGSPYWMAPELMQAVIQKDANPDLALAVDIWSLGCTIIEMFTGKPPWSEYEGAAAMFKVMKDTPSIPETLSSEGKDFLRCCFQRNPAERPSAARLLEHRFLKNSQPMNVPSCTQSFNGMKLKDTSHSPRERIENKLDQLHKFPSVQYTRGKTAFDSEAVQQSHQETCDLTVASRYSPRSTLEALPSLSPPCSSDSTRRPSPSASLPSSTNHDTKKNRIFR